jgi:hypothetical protein
VWENLKEPSFAIKIDNCNATTWPEVFLGLSKIDHSIFKVVIRIAGEYQVYPISWNKRVMMLSQNDLDILVASFPGLFFNIFIHPRIDIHGVYLTGWTNCIRQAEGKVAATGTKVGDVLSGLYLKGTDYLFRMLPAISPEPFVCETLEACTANATGHKEKENYRQKYTSFSKGHRLSYGALCFDYHIKRFLHTR